MAMSGPNRTLVSRSAATMHERIGSALHGGVPAGMPSAPPRGRPEKRREAPSDFEYRAASSHFWWDDCLAYGKQRSKRGQFPSGEGWIGKIGDRVA